MKPQVPHPVLKGAKALVVGITNEHSIGQCCNFGNEGSWVR